MSFVQREIDKIQRTLAKEPDSNKANELRIANQALSWSLDPGGIAAPFQTITGIQEVPADYWVVSGQEPFSDNHE